MFLEMQILALGSRFAFLRQANVFLLRLKMTIVFFKKTVRIPLKKQSNGIYEEWHRYDLRKKLCAYEGIGSPIHFYDLSENIQITL